MLSPSILSVKLTTKKSTATLTLFSKDHCVPFPLQRYYKHLHGLAAEGMGTFSTDQMSDLRTKCLLRIGKVIFINSCTVFTFGFSLLYSALRTLLCPSNDVWSSLSGIGGNSNILNFRTVGVTTPAVCCLTFLGFFFLRRSLNLVSRPLTIAPYE